MVSKERIAEIEEQIPAMHAWEQEAMRELLADVKELHKLLLLSSHLLALVFALDPSYKAPILEALMRKRVPIAEDSAGQ